MQTPILGEVIDAAGKSKRNAILVQAYSQSMSHHVYRVATMTSQLPAAQSSRNYAKQYIQELWLSLLKHICGIHEWADDDSFELVKGCPHGPMELRDYHLETHMDAYKRIEKIMRSLHHLETISMLTLNLSTSYLESLHTIMGQYVDKRGSHSDRTYMANICLAILDHNENCGHGFKFTEDGDPICHRFMPKKQGAAMICLCQKQNSKTYNFWTKSSKGQS